MKKVLFLIFISMLFTSCEDMLETKVIDLKAVLRVTPDEPFVTDDNDGVFTENKEIRASDVTKDLEDLDLTTVTEVNVSSINININENSGNEAQYVVISGFYEDENTQRTPVFSNYSVTLSEFGGTALTPVTGYQLTGINLLSDKLFAIVQNNDFGSFTLTIEGFSTDANGNPTGDAILLNIDAEIEAEAIFTEELDVPDFP